MNAPRGASPESVIVIERATGNYSGYVPDLPGCIATGRTIDEATNNIRSAIEFHLDGMRDDGVPIPEPPAHDTFVIRTD
jgi:predicted RNase H-like HicB family nuclease